MKANVLKYLTIVLISAIIAFIVKRYEVLAFGDWRLLLLNLGSILLIILDKKRLLPINLKHISNIISVILIFIFAICLYEGLITHQIGLALGFIIFLGFQVWTINYFNNKNALLGK